MKKSSFKSKIIERNYSHLNEEQKGIVSIVFDVTIMLSLVLSIWVTGCCLLGIPEMVLIDGIGLLMCLALLLGIYFFGISFFVSRFVLVFASFLVTVIPVLFYGLESLFTLHLVILPMSGILMFSRDEKSTLIKYMIGFFSFCVALIVWDFYQGAIFHLSREQSRLINILIAVGGIGISFYYTLYYFNENTKYKNLITFEREKSDRLLSSLFPQTIVEQLRESNQSVAESFDSVTVIFIDIVGFTELSSSINPAKLVQILDAIFSEFDKLVDKYEIEKIKTIGDAYMAVCGLPNPDEKHCQKVAELALEINELVSKKIFENYQLKVRIGIHTGRVVAGVIGNKKFSYDLWGDTVNIASRFESAGQPEKIHITEVVKNVLGSSYVYQDCGEIKIKGKGMMKSFYLQSKVIN